MGAAFGGGGEEVAWLGCFGGACLEVLQGELGASGFDLRFFVRDDLLEYVGHGVGVSM